MASSTDLTCTTLNRFLLQEQRKVQNATGDLTHLLNSIVTVVKAISSSVRSAGMTRMFGVAGHHNTKGKVRTSLPCLS